MNKIRWYKRDPHASLEGMAGLTLEERGALNTVLDLIYAHDGEIQDHDRFIANWLCVNVRIWKRIRKILIAKGKLYVSGPSLRNARADQEVAAALGRIALASRMGMLSTIRRAEASILMAAAEMYAGDERRPKDIAAL